MVKRVAAASADGDDIVELPAGADAAAEDGVVRTDASPADDLPKLARLNDDGSITLTLAHPRTLKSQRAGETVQETRYTELVFHRMTGADLRAISAASKESGLAVGFQKSTRLNHAIAAALFDKLDAEDANACLEIVHFFFGRGGRSGR